MTKETKIGLLVGLAFIILFAIILSEKGTTKTSSAPSTLTLADADQDRPDGAAGDRKPFDRAGRLPIEGRLQNPVATESSAGDASSPSEVPLEPPFSDEDEGIMPLPKSVVDRLNMPPIETEIPVATGSRPIGTESMSLADVVAEGLSGSGQRLNPPVEDEAAAASLGLEMTTASHLDQPSPLGSSPPGDERAKTAMKLLTVHKIRRGESLGRIAARYYGRATPERIEAIFNANRDKLSSIHSVRAEDTLAIPELDERQNIAFEPVTDFAPAEVVSAKQPSGEAGVRIPIPLDERVGEARPAPPGANERIASVRASGRSRTGAADFTWYEVRKKDTLSLIAKRELGSEGRFGEIYRLNRDIIRDKHMIKPGMKIRLPVNVGQGSSASETFTALMPESMEP